MSIRKYPRTDNDHDCLRKEDFNDFFEFKEKLIGFVESKNTLNGVTQRDIRDLSKRVDEIDAKINRLLFIFVTASITMIISIVLKY